MSRERAVIQIQAESEKAKNFGSGFFVKVIDTVAFALTDAHVIPSDTQNIVVTMQTAGGPREMHSDRIAIHVLRRLSEEKEDLALLGIDMSGISEEFPTLPLRFAPKAADYQAVRALGYTAGHFFQTPGTIQGSVNLPNGFPCLTAAIPCKEGQSGGPLIDDTTGEVVGVLRAKGRDGELIVTPISFAQNFLHTTELNILKEIFKIYERKTKVKDMFFPVSYSYHRIMIHGEENRLDNLFILFETMLKFLATVMIGDYLRCEYKNQMTGNGIVSLLTNSPTLSDLGQIIQLIWATMRHQETSCIPEIYKFYDESKEIIENFVSLQQDRNITDGFLSYLSELENLLIKMDFLSKYMIIASERVLFVKGGECHNLTVILNGHKIEFTPITTHDKPLDTDVIVLAINKEKEGEKRNEYRDFMPLYPLFLFKKENHQGAPGKILLYSGVNRDNTGQLTNLAYIDCQSLDVINLSDPLLLNDFESFLRDLSAIDQVHKQATDQTGTGADLHDDVVEEMKKAPDGTYQSVVEVIQKLKGRGTLVEGIDALRAKHTLQQHLAAGYPLLSILSWEEDRVVQALTDIAQTMGYALYVWNVSRGLAGHNTHETLRDPAAMLDWVSGVNHNALFVLQDVHSFLYEPLIQRKLKDAAARCRKGPLKQALVLVSPFVSLPDELEKDLTVFSYPLPEEEELAALLFDIIKRNNVRGHFAPEDFAQLASAALGLTVAEAEGVFHQAILAGDHTLAVTSVQDLIREKERVVRKTGLLEFCHVPDTLQDVGGLPYLKQWLRRHQDDSTYGLATLFGLPPTKGVLLVGVPGCGKSLCARAIAAAWQRPLLRLDIGRLFSGQMGASEDNMRQSIAIAEAAAPAVLWIDEIDRGFSGATRQEGSGVTARLLGTFLTWMQEKRSPVFVVATANDVSALPSEFIRGGRFDAVFFVDLPAAHEREEIFRIHLTKRQRAANGIQLEQLHLAALARMTDGFSGAEIEQAIVAALYEAFEAGARPVTEEDIRKSLRETVPLSHTMREHISALRQWGRGYALPA